MDTTESGRKPALVQKMFKKRMEKRGGDTMNKVQCLNKARRRRKRQSVIAKKGPMRPNGVDRMGGIKE